MASIDPSVHTCPSETELLDHLAHGLDGAAATAIAAHLAECPACAARVAALRTEHEVWIARLQSAGAPPERGAEVHELSRDDVAGYEILEEINRGGQGIVYRALQKSTKREVALKVLREGPHASPAARRRFEREIELVAALQHPHIVTVFDSGETRDRRQYFVMDYVRGRRLDAYLAAERPDLATRLALFSQICHAVNYAHQRSVIHRDLKPANILIGADGQPRILDFGLARHIVEAGPAALTTTRQLAGTLPYMSPEQARGLPDAADVRSDVYALGVMLYEMLAGAYPYPVTDDTLESLRHIVETPPGRLRGRARFVGPVAATARPLPIDDELETIVLKALAKERERRYQTAGELARDIDRYLAHEPIEAKRDSGLYVLRKALRRYRVAAGVIATFIVVVTAAAIALGVMYGRQVRLRAEAERQGALARAAEVAAERRFGQVRDLARFFVVDFDPLIARLPGAAPARQALVEKGLAYLDALAQEAAGDQTLQRELAAAYVTIGDVQGDLVAANLGDSQAAVASYRKALRILEESAAQTPELAVAQNARLLYRNKLGDALRVLGADDEALALYEEVLRLGQGWQAAHPQDERTVASVLSAHERIGTLKFTRGDSAAALTHFEPFLAHNRAEAEAQPDDLWKQRALGVALTKMGSVHYVRREYAEALTNYHEFLAIGERLRAAHPDNLVALRDVGIAQQWIGIISADSGDRAAALAGFAASNDVFDALLKADSQDSVSQTQLVINHSKIGEIQLADGQRAAAAQSFERTVALVEPLAQRHADRPDVLRLQAVAYYKLADLERARAADAAEEGPPRAAHWQAAREWLTKCRAVFLDLQARNLILPTDTQMPDELAAEIAACDAELASPASAPATSAPSRP